MAKKIIAILLILLLIVGGAGAWLFFNSPERMLQKLSKDVADNGYTAVRPYLTEPLQQNFDKAASAAGKVSFGANLISGLLPDAVTDAISGKASDLLGLLSDSAGPIKVSLEGVTRGLKDARATLRVQNNAVDTTVDLVLRRVDRQWLISDVSVPMGLSK